MNERSRIQCWNFNPCGNWKFKIQSGTIVFRSSIVFGEISLENLKYRSIRRNRIYQNFEIKFSEFPILCLRSGSRSIIYHAPGSESEPIRWIWMHVSRIVFRQMIFWDWSPWTNQVENLANQRKADIQVIHDVCWMMSKEEEIQSFDSSFFFRLTSWEINTDFRMLFSFR